MQHHDGTIQTQHFSNIIGSLQATGDPYYLRVGQSIVEKLNAYARVPCGFAAVQDVRTGMHEDRYTNMIVVCNVKRCDLLMKQLL